MPIDVKSLDDLKPGDFYEDCAFHPCLCVRIDDMTVEGISLADGSFPRQCDIGHCGIRKLTFEEAVRWRFFGPIDLPDDLEMADEFKFWLKDYEWAKKFWPYRKSESEKQIACAGVVD